MTQIQSIRRRRLRWALAAALLVLLFAALLLTWRGQAGAATNDTLRFNHQKHLAAGVPCVFCHPGALNGPVAGVPSVQKCVGCHQNVQVTSEKGQADVDLLMQLWKEGRPLRWVKTYDQPDFVYFSHRPHVVAGVNCEVCHGDVSQMTVVRQAYRINMGFCLPCHRQQEPEKVERLISCATCHK
jgi:hypothetical protein